MTARCLALALLILIATAAHADTSCPSNLVQAGSVTKNSTDPTANAGGGVSCGDYGGGSASAFYDIPHARFFVDTRVYGDCGASAHVTVQDDFRVIGLAAGTPVAITVVLHVSANWSGGSVSDAYGNQASIFITPYDGGLGDVSLPISALGQQPFRLTFDSKAQADYAISGQASCSFSFTGLPPGTAVVSCNGYVSDQPVAARPTSWGRLKSMYR